MKSNTNYNRTGLEVAIIGIGCRFPGANNPDEFWQNLIQGKESITQLTDEMLMSEGIPKSSFKNKNYVKSAALLENVKCFDASFFDIPPREAVLTDPQQRFLMEVVWEALEDAGYNPDSYQKKIGLYAGGGINTYLFSNLLQNKSLVSNVTDLNIYITNHIDSLATRIAYKLGLTGPAVTVQTACSTSLVTTHLACQSLLTGDAEIAISAGVKISIPHYSGYQFQEDGIKSKDGHCRPFDDKATGTVFGSGAGVIVLKLLDKAIEDNDNIYAIIKGSAINNDGNIKMNYASPGIMGQAAVIQEALCNADIAPHTLSYIETHGTATHVGDPIEIAALKQALGNYSDKKRCAIGSVKSNIGHLDVAAGLASLIKTALALRHKKIPASINFNSLNKQINFQDSPFYINTTLKNWEPIDDIRRAGVSSFGLGGTNAHIILEEVEDAPPLQSIEKFRIIPLSAKTDNALNQVIQRLIEFLTKNSQNLADLAYTLAIGRKHFAYRKAFIADSIDTLLTQLKNFQNNKMELSTTSELNTLSQQWEQGLDLDWEVQYQHEKLKKISLPTYPFDKTEYWILPTAIAVTPEIYEENSDKNATLANVTKDNIIQFAITWFKEILGVSNVQAHDNFFELGGDSLSAINLTEKIEKQLALQIPIAKIISAPSPLAIAEIIWIEKNLPEIGTEIKVKNGNFFPLSAEEMRFWLAEQINPKCKAYCVPVTFKIEGNLNLKSFRLAIQQLAKRHDCFSSTFKLEKNNPVRITHSNESFDLEFINCVTLKESEVQAISLLTERCSTGFNLETGPLARAILLQYDQDKYFFGLVLHHILVDGHSMSILIDELSLLYRSLIANQPLPLSNSTKQARPLSFDREKEKTFWQDYLSGIIPKSAFLPDFPNPNMTGIPSKRIEALIEAELLNKLIMLATQEKTSLFVVLLSAWLMLTYRYSGDDDFIVGYPINQRGLKSSEEELGPKINTIPFRAKLTETINFLELTRYVHEQHILLLQHSNLSYEEMTADLLKTDSVQAKSLVQNYFVYQNTRQVNLALPEVITKSFDIELGYSQHDITLVLVPDKGIMQCNLEYNTHLFQHENMQKVLDTFLILLKRTVEAPTTPITLIPLSHERIPQNTDQDVASRYKTVIELFEQQIASFPLQTAVICGQQKLSYMELNTKANQLARYFINCGVKKGNSILVQANRSESVLIALLAIFKVGAVYIPMAPCTLAERRKSLVQQIKPVMILSNQENDFHFLDKSISLLDLNNLDAELSKFDTHNLNIQMDGDELAYILFTSGSTGEPKGVEVTHGSLINNINWRIAVINLNSDDKILHTISFAFDPSLWQFLGPICSGGCVVIGSDQVTTDIDYFIYLIETHKITVLDFTPSLLRIFLKVANTTQVRSVRHVFCGGESLDHSLISQFYSTFSAALFNQYGPTETTIDATFWPVEKNWFGIRAPIGKPINHVEAYVLDKHHNICPVGAIGELFIGGKNLARGYFNDPELTNSKFIYVENFDSSPKRLYKTGDLARSLASREIEFYGRKDTQVKINGIRVDLQELTNVIHTHPAIQICFPEVEKSSGLTSLILYIQLKNNQKITYDDLTSFLHNKLPSYLIPHSIELVNEFPYTASGKIDSKKLKNISSTHLSRNKNTQRAMTEIEKTLAEIYSEVLQLDYAKVNQNLDFFAIGGNSLQAIFAISRIRKQFQIDISVEILFKHPILSDLAKFLWQKTTSLKPETVDDNQPHKDTFPLSFAQDYIWNYTGIPVNSSLNNVPVFLKLQGKIDITILEKTIDLLIKQHEVLRTIFFVNEKEINQQIEMHKPTILSQYNLSKIPLDPLSEKIQDEFATFIDKPFEFSEALFRCALFSFANNTHILIFTLHRLIYDGRSDLILIRDIIKNYRTLKNDSPYEISSLLQYKNFIKEEKEFITEDFIHDKVTRLVNQFSDFRLKLPFKWKSNTSIPESDFKTLSCSVSKDIIKVIEDYLKLTGITFFVLFISVVQKSLSAWLKNGKYLLAIPTIGRLDEKFFDVMGRFVNLSLLPSVLNDTYSLNNYIDKNKQASLILLENQMVPIQSILKKLSPTFIKPDIFVGYFEESDPYSSELGFSISRQCLVPEKPEFPVSINIISSSNYVTIDLKYITEIENSGVNQLIERIHQELVGLKTT